MVAIYNTNILFILHTSIFCIIGFFFKSLASIDNFGGYVLNKTIVLGIPYIFYSVVQFTLQSVGGSTVRDPASFEDLLGIYNTPLVVSWYLYVLWWIFIFMGFISIWIKDTNKLLILTIILFVFSMVIPQKIYILQMLILWLFFFVLGYWLRKTNINELLKRKWKNVSLICIVIITIFMIIWKLGNPTFYVSYDFPGLKGLIFPVSVILAFAIYPIISKIELFGNYFKTYGKDSIIIYLLHAPIVSVTRIVLLKVGIDNVFLYIIIGLLTGWFGSIIAIHITKKIKYLDFVFYPMKWLYNK